MASASLTMFSKKCLGVLISAPQRNIASRMCVHIYYKKLAHADMKADKSQDYRVNRQGGHQET